MSAVIATRTPEGEPFHCPFCGLIDRIELSDPAGDAPCPRCGHLLWPEPMPPPPLPELREILEEGDLQVKEADLREFQAWLNEEMADRLTPAQIVGLFAHANRVIAQHRWDRARRERFFARLREQVRRHATPRPHRPRRPGILSWAMGLLGATESVAATAPGTDPLYDPWLDGG